MTGLAWFMAGAGKIGVASSLIFDTPDTIELLTASPNMFVDFMLAALRFKFELTGDEAS